MSEILKLLIGAVIAAIPAYYLMWSQHRKNVGEGEASSASAAATLNKQTIDMINSMRHDLDQQKHNGAVLEDKVFILEQQVKQERRDKYLYKKYINYVLKGDEENRAQIECDGKKPVFVPVTLEAFEAAQNA